MLRHSSTILIIAVALLCGLGLVMLASTGVWVRDLEQPYHFVIRQSVMVVIGVFAAFVMAKTPPEVIRKSTVFVYVLVCIALALCFVPAVNVEIYGSKRWIDLPFIGQFQPSEPAKMIVVVALAAWFARWQTEVHTFFRGFVIPGMITGLPLVLIALETDVGTALSLSVTAAAVMYCVGSRLRYIIPAGLVGISGAAWYLYNNPNRWGRIEAWLDLENPVHQLDRGMQQWRALLALGNGGPWGVGLGNGVEKFGTLTFAHIDFIYPVIGEELGLPATLGVIICYVGIAVAGVGIALQAKQIFERSIALGLTCVIVVPAMVNIGVTTAVLPNDGLPLPFVSYGGTSLVFSLAAVGLLVGIHRRSQIATIQAFPLGKDARGILRL
ncbi:FtsW/RodA/SpoVE family cell cycle protein [Luteolibacter algae]|uniref:Probable peptidoglycan glycosyltransferase FtsW n=1 Tax=Luteolibacter algae TaxID=454151 RepID=A0ABW5D9V3_9BACT